MTHKTSSQLPTGSGSALGRTQILTLILLGIYDPETLERVPVCCPSGDSLPIARLLVEDGATQLLDLPGE